ncbi:MAG: S8 family serine peptidase, partial [Hungatella sp.]
MTPCTANTSGEDYADFIYRHNGLSMQELYEELENPCLDFVNSNYVIIHAPLDQVLPLSLERYPYSSIPKLYALLDTTSMEASGILAVSRQPKFQADGNGALIGLIDTGIDYQNPVFRKPDGSSRILGILDQTLGESFTQAQLDEALQSPDPLSIVPSTDTIGHGTFLAGIAAGGSSDAKDFIGAAPLAGIAMVKLKPAKQYLRDFFLIRPDAIAYQENDIMLGITYLVFLAAKYRMPLSILISLGHNQGSHNGLSPLSQVLNRLGFFRGVSVSCAAGNEVGFRKHYFQPMAREVKFDETELRVGSAERGFTLELW